MIPWTLRTFAIRARYCPAGQGGKESPPPASSCSASGGSESRRAFLSGRTQCGWVSLKETPLPDRVVWNPLSQNRHVSSGGVFLRQEHVNQLLYLNEALLKLLKDGVEDRLRVLPKLPELCICRARS